MTLATAAFAPSRAVQTFGVLCPALAAAIAGPFTVVALQAPGQDALFLVAPTAAGIAAAPGYLYALLGWRSIPRLSAAARWWVRLSFTVVVVASAVGAVFSLVLIVPSAACIATVVNALVAWRRLEAGTQGLHGVSAGEGRA